MRKKYIFGKKLYISILTTIVVLLTTVATTFAWVGVFANSTFDTFDVTIKSNSLEEYGVEISLSGEENTFSESISGEEIKKAILLNWGYSESKINSYGVEALFSSLNMDQCTTLPVIENNEMKSLGVFKDLEGNLTRAYFKFDLYVSAVKFYERGTTSEYLLDVFLEKGLITGTNKSRMLFNPFSYPDTFINPLSGTVLPTFLEPVPAATKITTARVNSKSVCRVAFEKYEVVDKYHPEQYLTSSLPKSTIIYTGDSYDYPTYNTQENVYEFGGILNDDLNVAVGYYNSTEWKFTANGIKEVSVEDSHANLYGGDIYSIRGVGGSHSDKIFSSATNHLIDSTNPNEVIKTDKMMKIGVSFWIEGWDSDCFNVIGNSPVSLTVAMSIKQTEESF